MAKQAKGVKIFSNYLKEFRVLKVVLKESKRHIPFTLTGAGAGVVVIVLMGYFRISKPVLTQLFNILHPLHVFLSAMATTAVYLIYRRDKVWQAVLIGYFGSVGIATVSDSLIPYFGEWLLNMPYRAPHIGFIEEWLVVNGLAIAGIAVAFFWPKTKAPHLLHVFFSTWASLLHISMAMGVADPLTLLTVFFFIFIAVWIPCCMSDIVFLLLFVGGDKASACC